METKQQPPAKSQPTPPNKSDEELRCKNIDNYYGDMICRPVNQNG